MSNYKNIYRINKHQIYAEINNESIIVSDLDEPTKDIFTELNKQMIGTREQWEEYNAKKLVLSPKEQASAQIFNLKRQLAAMDYKTSKYADGEYTEVEWAEIAAERKAIRNKIRKLEQEVANAQENPL